MMDWIRHGDVILERVEFSAREFKKCEEVVLAEGKVTGHFHRLQGQLLVTELKNNERFVRCEQDAVLSHEEHDTLVIPKGEYRVLLQREVDLLGEVRQVMD